ncbi:hypothetical protein F7734_32860 [Scytonema sp. UIC 10036]|uniref:hypothetical protein n=1 Tax=Scytonema sp. UIC 10036 TaxID=2304196 RepID=UPI0012DA11F4|nr:hypothetical protein [Scytonema sp. UIC 10036]MUG96877.1 hypothetical protein [Scytonema sp. UIC 10036]
MGEVNKRGAISAIASAQAERALIAPTFCDRYVAIIPNNSMKCWVSFLNPTYFINHLL